MSILSVRRSILVEADRDRAFDVFTNRFGAWWPSTYFIGRSAYETAIVEPFAGGRWYERDVDGSECDWGRVLIWEPPSRVMLAWQISADWQFDPEPVTEIDVLFEETGPKQTRVELEHRHLERYGPRAAEMHAIFDSGGVPGAPKGWAGLLTAYASLV